MTQPELHDSMLNPFPEHEVSHTLREHSFGGTSVSDL